MIIVVQQIPWTLWLPLGIAFAIAAHVGARRLLGSVHSHRPWFPFIAGMLVGAGVVSMATAAAPRSAQEPAPIPDDGTGFEQGRIPAAPGLSAVPSEAAPPSLWPVLASPSVAPRDEDVLPRHVRAPAISASTPAPSLELRGPASWYCLPGRSACTHGFAAGGAYAAAGPRIRAALGAHWRGRVVLVDGVPVRLIDWCACPGGRLLDLYAAVFRRLGPLSAGVLEVTIVPRGTIR